MTPGTSLDRRFARHVAGRGLLSDGDRVLVALSGGVDSSVLLHLLRFGDGLPALVPVAAHLDHGMRPGSARDADWVRGLCRAWDVPLTEERLAAPPASEAEARAARYRFLSSEARATGARWCVTAHHGDDQAETVLFRAVRGGEPSALRGIRERRGRLWRPLLPFTRADLEAYARHVGLRWREDPTNRHALPRNVIRHRILPELEASVAPAARRSLRRLARRSAEDEAGWRQVTELLSREAGVRPEGDGLSLDRAGAARLHSAVLGRLLRVLSERLGHRLTEAGTRLAVEFTRSSPSGGGVRLSGGLTLHREFDRLVLAPDGPIPEDVTASIAGVGTGSADVLLGGRCYRVRWAPGRDAARGVSLAVTPPRFPLTIRARAPGDRIRLPYGTKKVKKLLLEARVPALRRASVPIVADASGAVLCVHGVARAADAEPSELEEILTIEIDDADAD